MRCAIQGIGVWCPGAGNRDELHQLLQSDRSGAEALALLAPPAPAAIAPRERRRAPAGVKMAVAVAEQACEQAGVDPATLASVFSSGMGDTAITDYMCRALLTEDRLLSPTKFHNSVHNAPSGYWTIATRCHRPANSVSGFRHSFPVALLEAASQCTFEQCAVLLVVHDVPTPPVFDTLLPVNEPFAAAFVLAPGDTLGLSVETGHDGGHWPDFDFEPLTALYHSNPSARALPFLQALYAPRHSLSFPLGPASRLRVKWHG